MESLQEKQGGARLSQRTRSVAAVFAVVAVCCKLGVVLPHEGRSSLLGGDPYGTLARSAPELGGGAGVLARSRGGMVAMDGSLSGLASSALAMNGDLSGAGVGPDNSWQETGPESAYPGGFLFANSLKRDPRDVAFERDQGGATGLRTGSATKLAHGVHKGAMRRSREVIYGSLATLPSSDAESGGVLSVAGGDDGQGTLAHMPSSNPDGVLAIYAHTGEYVDRQRLAQEEKRLSSLENMEKQARAMHKTQVKRLKALESQQEHAHVAHKARVAARASASVPPPRATVHAAKKAVAAAVKPVARKSPVAPKAGAVKVHMKHVAAAATKLPLPKLGAAPADTTSKEEKVDPNDSGVGSYEDVGWVKHEWGAGSWVLFFIFGPIVTVAICGLVWHCAGIIPALVMLFILCCLDLVSYYYSWYLV
mmetsp:Transcript_34643/g.67890  ORF Transcript_34643/g.67890 Transcript_34643/m.67890 type:complete len:422 (+) Transcript_34643:104-1369(+)|eukprot:CAMPEP_0173382392 /NCGR_PEP_ID=MMETSP1356-20130122/4895_1 /TAXON_ID=77927 ORGANISM="Hemiselmis virescens, Strain PCC157" /NCGR_SAMPLE_ID=MMETSP1356 /ASSEMBLY_ACC=CAM_ASM_000847 /LENGTH=421 /DNA_ID=CAMNT_0014336707 /DNA_START=95 /DNA_END=1360 /DNA_ORIENTATION=-